MATASTNAASSSIQEGTLRLHVPDLANVKLLIMNAKGQTEKGYADKRKHAISTIINKYKPNIVFFQEFLWADIKFRKGQKGAKDTWAKYPIPKEYELFKNNDDASIMILDASIMILVERDFPPDDIVTRLLGLHITPGLDAADIDNWMKNTYPDIYKRMHLQRVEVKTQPTDYWMKNTYPDIYKRRHLQRVEVKTQPTLDLISISWHGESSIKAPEKLQKFEELMKFLGDLKEKCKLPILVGGDFNIEIHKIRRIVKFPFYPSFHNTSRRQAGEIIDFYIIYGKITLVDIQCLDINRDTPVKDPNHKILDHEPVLATLKPLERTMSASLFRMKSSSPRKRSSTL